MHLSSRSPLRPATGLTLRTFGRTQAVFSVCLLLLVATAGCRKTPPKGPLFDRAAFFQGAGRQGPDGQAIAFVGGPEQPAAPLSLTASDGTGLQPTDLVAKTVIEGPLAFTELHLTFANPEARQREGRFSITLPPTAAINRFAMRTHGRWMEGEVVEKQQARRIYEDYLHRKQDPALLEQDAGNTFRARVFPIPANGSKQLIVSYTSELPTPETPYVLPLRGLGTLRSLQATVAVQVQPAADRARAPKVVQLNEQGFRPSHDLVVHPSAAGGLAAQRFAALRRGDLVAARITVPKSRQNQGFGEVLVLVDTSASEAVQFDRRLARLTELMAYLAKRGATHVQVVAFDQVAAPIFAGAPKAWGQAEVATLRDRGALGASDWGAALSSVAQLAAGKQGVRVLVFGNGVATAGVKETDALKAIAAKLGKAGVVRIDTLEMAAQRDQATLRAIATAGLPQGGVHVQLPTGEAPADFSALQAATIGAINVGVQGAKWVWPQRLQGLRGGDSALIFAQQEGGPVQISLTGGVTLKRTLKPQRASRALLETAWVRARIERLLHDSAFGDPDMRPMAKQQALKLSIKHRVLCELTALLVLESEREYARYKLDRTDLAKILSVTPDLEVAALDRARLYAQADAPKPASPAPPRGAVADRNTAPAPGDDGVKLEEKREEEASAPADEDAPEATEKRTATVGDDDERGEPAHEAPAPRPQAAASAASVVADSRQDRPTVRPPARRKARRAAKALQRREPPAAAQDALFEAGIVPGIGGGKGAGAGAGTGLGRRPAGAGGLAKKPAVAALHDRLANRPTTRPAPDPEDAAAARRALRRARRERARLRSQRLRLARETAKVRAERQRLEAERQAQAAAAAALAAGRKELKTLRDGIASKPNIRGQLAKIRFAIEGGKHKTALRLAWAWRREDPANVMALVALGDAFLAQEEPAQAARAYGSLIDLFPSRADLRRFAGNLLDTTAEQGHRLAIDTYRAAVAQRPDHPAGYHMLAMALAVDKQLKEAMAVVRAGLQARRRAGNFAGVDRILRDDLAMLQQAASGNAAAGQVPANLRFILTWETDANDVDFHIFDSSFNHASFRQHALPSGGELYADITTGYGPECFRIDRPTAYPYQLLAHYYAMGPMGYGMGRLQVVRYDGASGFGVESRPFVIMQDRAYVDLGTVTAKSAPIFH